MITKLKQINQENVAVEYFDFTFNEIYQLKVWISACLVVSCDFCHWISRRLGFRLGGSQRKTPKNF